MKKKIIAAASVVLALSACEPVDTATPAPPPTANTSAGIYTSGTYEVPSEIKPGTYKTGGPSKGELAPMCYWARLRNMTGDPESIIANGNLEGPATFVVKKTDKGVELSGSCSWRKAK
jgi:hypothetical protein